MPKSSRDKNEGTYWSGEGGEEGLLCDPRSELLTTGRERDSARIINGMTGRGETCRVLQQ